MEDASQAARDSRVVQGGSHATYTVNGERGAESYVADWALSREDEKAAFERFVDFVIVRLKTHPALHIYHYAPYEPAALKRLMGRYATREDEIDRMLRAGVFVDL